MIQQLQLLPWKKRVSLLHEILANLSNQQKVVIYCRFWESMNIEEIAQATNLEWREVNQLIECTLRELKQKILSIRK